MNIPQREEKLKTELALALMNFGIPDKVYGTLVNQIIDTVRPCFEEEILPQKEDAAEEKAEPLFISFSYRCMDKVNEGMGNTILNIKPSEIADSLHVLQAKIISFPGNEDVRSLVITSLCWINRPC